MYCDYCGSYAISATGTKYCFKCGKPYTGNQQSQTTESAWPQAEENPATSESRPVEPNTANTNGQYQTGGYYPGYQSFYRPQASYAPRQDWGGPLAVFLKVFIAIMLISLFIHALPAILFFGLIFLVMRAIFWGGNGWGYRRRGRWY